MGNKVLMNTGRPRPPNAGKGRRCGVPNVMPGAVKDMVLEALHAAGGVAYLTEQAHRQPAAFLVLLCKVLPRKAMGQGTGAFVIQIIGGVPHSSARPKSMAEATSAARDAGAAMLGVAEHVAP